jgi:nitroimidazol reductase NimA-like FMN-containing flavoprotein (pyridoxamine 5'-phosphate oxidase superfamily)
LTVLSDRELGYLKGHTLCRLATASREAEPQVTPVIYAMDGEDIIIAIDYGEKKLKNLRENPKAALVVDEYRPNRAVMVRGNCEIFERGKEYLRIQKVLYGKFEYYRKNPWKEGESPILRIRPTKCVSWGV